MQESSGLRVGVMGAGAVGAYVGGRLAAESNAQVVFVGRAKLQDELNQAGLCLTDLNGHEARLAPAAISFETEPSTLANCDVVLCCVKSGQTAEVAAQLADIVSDGAVVVSLQNGVRNAEVLRQALPKARVLAGIVEFNVVWRGDGRLAQTTKGQLLIEASTDRSTQALMGALVTSGVGACGYSDIVRHQWTKLLVNLNNAVSALSGAPTPEMLLNAGYRRIVTAVMREGLTVVRAAGVKPATLRGIPVGILLWLMSLPTPVVRLVARAQLQADPEARSSMWADLERRRLTEVDFLNGEVVRMAERHGVSAPLNARIVALVREAEAAAEGSPNLSADAFWSALH